MNKRFMNWLRHPSDSSATAALVLLIVGGLIVVLGYDYLHGTIRLRNVVEDFYANASSELISIAITVLVIDQLNQRRARNQETEQKRIAQEAEENAEKKRLILQMGSPNNMFAVEAVRALKARGWLQDGTLNGANLEGANLQGANLEDADIQGVDLMKANLQEANLIQANLQKANIGYANLQGAFLGAANLQAANLGIANLQEADLRGAKLQGAGLELANLQRAIFDKSPLHREKNAILDETTWLPDGSKYDPKTGLGQLKRFTDPKFNDPDNLDLQKRNFWRPEPKEWLRTQTHTGSPYPWWYASNDQT